MTAGKLEQRRLLLNFYAFGDNLKTKRVSHGDRCPDKALSVPVGGDSSNERTIEFELIESKTAHIADARETRAEVIEGNGHVQIAKDVERLLGLSRTGDQIGLGDLEFQAGGREAKLV